MRVIIVDDERPSLSELAYYLGSTGDTEILGMYTSPQDALENIIKKNPDAIFVDIEMPELNGLALANEVLKHDEDIGIVFCTAYEEFALSAFELNAVDYILKPFSEERINTALKKLKKNKEMNDVSLRNMRNDAITKEADRKGEVKIPVWKGDRIYLCNLSDVDYMCTEERQTSIYTCNGKIYYCRDTLNYWEDRLKSTSFFRSHKSYLVNTDKIDEIIPWFNNTYMVKMKGSGNEIPVSRSAVKNFRKIFGL